MNKNQAQREVLKLFGRHGRAFRTSRGTIQGRVNTIFVVGEAKPGSGDDEASTAWNLYGEGVTWEVAFKNLAARIAVRAANAVNEAAHAYALIAEKGLVPKKTQDRARAAGRELCMIPVVTHGDIFSA